MQKADWLQEIAEKVGLSVKPAGKRGEVVIIFPRKGREPLSLRLSRLKAVELVFWLFNNLPLKGTRVEDEVMPWEEEENQKGG